MPNDRLTVYTGNRDYATYARGGFLQLIAVTVLVLAVIAGLALGAQRAEPPQPGMLRAVGGLLCVLTLVAAAVAVLIALAAVNPEALMARTHIGRLDPGYPVDTEFLATLSTDAVDEIRCSRQTGMRRAPGIWRRPSPGMPGTSRANTPAG